MSVLSQAWELQNPEVWDHLKIFPEGIIAPLQVHRDNFKLKKKSYYSQNNLFKELESGVHFSKDFMQDDWFFLNIFIGV